MASRIPRPPRTATWLSACVLLLAVAAPTWTQAQQLDREYTAKILEFTTEPFFATPLVDHLPASETVPTPLDFLGHIAGAADVLTYPADIYALHAGRGRGLAPSGSVQHR